MNKPDLKRTIFDKVQSFNAKCKKQRDDITKEREKEKQEEREREKREQNLIAKFDETILKDLQSLFSELEPSFSSPYLEILLDTHHQRKRFHIFDRETTPAFAFFALDAKSREDEETFDRTRYLLFSASVSGGGSFDLFVKNQSRDPLGHHEEDEDSTVLQSYSFDGYDFDQIREHIEKYLIEELSYLHENFQVEIEEWED